MAGRLVISLDFELFWGVRDKYTLETYRDRLLGVRAAVPAMLDLFHEYGVRATWATVGSLFCSGREELLAMLPKRLPGYQNSKLSPFDAVHSLGDSEASDPFHFAPSLLRKIHAVPGQEIGTHTFSHYYCLEEGQSVLDFESDLAAAQRAARRLLGIDLRSIVFPRNQVNERYLTACAAAGLRSYRSNPPGWLFDPRVEDRETAVRRALRLADSYVPISGRNDQRVRGVDANGMVDVPASRFLRPYSARLGRLDGIRAARIVSDMRHAAKTDQIYHLWWHPHNWGLHLEENLGFLRSLLDEFASLRRRYQFESCNMDDIAQQCAQEAA